MTSSEERLPGLSVIVCTFNGSARLRRFLPAIAHACSAAPVVTELVVVDDGSTDTTADDVAVLVPQARLIRSAKNGGLPRARNLGAASARGKWLLYCDDDVVLSAEALSGLWARRQDGTCLVPTVRGPGGEIQNSVTITWSRGDPKFIFHQTPVPEPAFPVGSCFLVNREDYFRAGGCDERFFPMYYDDAALGARLRRAGTALAMAAEISVQHFEHGAESSPARLRTIQAWVYQHRWTYVLVALRGRRRAVALGLGLPRVAMEATRTRSCAPIVGYGRALRLVPTLLGSNQRRFHSIAPSQPR